MGGVGVMGGVGGVSRTGGDGSSGSGRSSEGLYCFDSFFKRDAMGDAAT